MAFPKGSIRDPKTGKMATNSRGEPILKGTTAGAKFGFGKNWNKGKSASGSRNSTGNRTTSRTTSRTQSRAGTGTRTQAKRNTTMRASRSA